MDASELHPLYDYAAVQRYRWSFDIQAREDHLLSLLGNLPSSPTIVEVGSGAGGLARLMAVGRPDAQIITIDSYKVYPEFRQKTHEQNINDNLDLTNITWMVGQSPDDFLNWNTELDAFVLDGAYDNIQIYWDNLIHWSQHVKPGGLMVGFAYFSTGNDAHFVHRAVLKTVERLHVQLHVFESMWWFYMPRK